MGGERGGSLSSSARTEARAERLNASVEQPEQLVGRHARPRRQSRQSRTAKAPCSMGAPVKISDRPQHPDRYDLRRPGTGKSGRLLVVSASARTRVSRRIKRGSASEIITARPRRSGRPGDRAASAAIEIGIALAARRFIRFLGNTLRPEVIIHSGTPSRSEASAQLVGFLRATTSSRNLSTRRWNSSLAIYTPFTS